MSNETSNIEDVIADIQRGSAYKHISPALIQRIAQKELEKRATHKEVIRSTRSKLHQVAGAYMDRRVNYEKLKAQMSRLPADYKHPLIREFCIESMSLHASTRERLPVLPEFFNRTLESIQPISSIIDLGCGLNPLAIPWMPLALDCQYLACDIYRDMAEFLEYFFQYSSINGKSELCDLMSEIPTQHAQLALLLKTIPCLEQIDKKVGTRLLEQLNTDHILVSFPMRSLTGRSKGMRQHYSQHFDDLISRKDWQVKRYEFQNELAFLLSH